MSISPQITEICQRSRISDYLTNKGFEIIRTGSRMKCKCPLPDHNERTPSFFISTLPDGTELFKCWGCGNGGNIITLIRLMEGGKNGKIIHRLAKALGMSLSPFSSGVDVRIDPTNDEVLRSFCGEDMAYHQMAEYALEVMTLHKGSHDIVDKVSRVYEKFDDLVERGDQEAISKTMTVLKNIAMEHRG